jgi:hypothetical protein
MPDYTQQLNQARAREKTDEKPPLSEEDSSDPAKPTAPTQEVAGAEFLIVGSIALLADLIGPFGFPFVIVLCLWYFFKFHKFPTKQILSASGAEIVSLGILPGWTGFVVWIYLEQKGYLGKIKMVKSLAEKFAK